MNIIFFDIDGVLNHQHCKGLVDWDIVERVMQMARDTGSKLVMSSSWKDVLHNPDNYSKFDKNFVHSIVETMGDLFIGPCPDVDEDNREVDVQSWLDEHPEVENFIVLDDIPYNFKAMFGDRFVQTTGFFEHGFTEENEKIARSILLRKGN